MHRRTRRARRGPSRTGWRGAALLLCFVSGLLPLAGCGSGEHGDRDHGTARRSGAPEAEWAWLRKTRPELDAQRARLAANPADPALAQQAQALSDEFNRRLVAFLNADPPVQGEPLTPRQREALRLKSDEDIVLARTFIEQGGDYERAIDIYKQALLVDPGNPRLREELARAQGRRYMTREAFVQIQKGMDQDEVRRLLGQPNLNNVHAYPDRGVVGWFYRKDPTGAAAAVWFHKEDGRFAVYLADFDALQPRQAAPAGPPNAPRAPQGAT
jgi:tetratricopeptide (TPR) repeat protein